MSLSKKLFSGGAAAPSHTTDNLVQYLNAADSTSAANFSAGSQSGGVTWVDLSGNGRDASINTSGATFSYTDSTYFTVPAAMLSNLGNIGSAIGAGAFTLEIFFYVDSSLYSAYPAYVNALGQVGVGASGFIWYIDTVATQQQQLSVYSSGTGYHIGVNHTPTVNRFNQYVAVRESTSSVKFYVDGSHVGTSTATNNYTAGTTVVIGNYTTSGTNYLRGRMGLIRIYSDALTASEVTANWDANKATFGR